jgi:NitT/TauT family transport system substrate-binding protein
VVRAAHGTVAVATDLRGTHMKRPLILLPMAAIVILALSGCTDSAAPQASTEPSTGGDELTAVRVASLPITESAALWAGVDAGIFEEHGLDVEVLPAQGGAQAIPALISGDIEFAIGQPFGPFRADLQDLGVVIIGNYAPSYADGDDTSGVIASAESGITRPADLAGKRVSVNSLGAAGDVTIMAAVEADGGDASTIEFIEVAFPDAAAQLDAGNIDAAWVPEPFMSGYVASGGTFVMHPYQETIPGLTTLTTFTTQTLIDEDPELVQAFADAMKESIEYANENEDLLRDAIRANLELPDAVTDSILLPVYSFEINASDLESLADLAVQFGVLPSAPDFDRIIQQY